MSVPDRIREVMAQRGLTIEAFAEQLGEKNPQRLKDVLRGKQRLPEAMTTAMADRGIDVAYVLTGRSEELERRLFAISQATQIAETAKGKNGKFDHQLQQAVFETLVNALSKDEQELVGAYRRCAEPDKLQVRQLAFRFAGEAAARPPSKPPRKRSGSTTLR